MKAPEHFEGHCTERYQTMRVLDLLTRFYGKRGVLLAGIARHFRYVDDVVDESGEPLENKLRFLARQDSLIHCGRLSKDCSEREQQFVNLPWNCTSHEDLLRRQSRVLLHTIIDDTKHTGYIPRNDREIRHYNWRALGSCFRMVNICLNDQDLRLTRRFMNLMNNLYTLGSLQDMKEDLDRSMIQVRISRDDVPKVHDRETVLSIYNQEKFYFERDQNRREASSNSRGIFETNMPLWQKFGFFMYVSTRAQYKFATVKYPQF